MAKKNKSLEDLLEEALDVDKEKCYVIPNNWIWINYDYGVDNVTSSKKKLKQNEYDGNGSIPVIDQGMSKVGGYTNNKDLSYDGELPVIVFGDHTKCVKYIDFIFVQGADGVKVLKPKNNILNDKYMYYLMLNQQLPDKGYSRHYKFLKETPIQVAPLEEQQRIANKIESLFSKIDKAKELIDESRKDFENRKASILAKAFRGELTKKWREENRLRMESWEETNLASVCSSIFDGDHMPPPKSDKGIPFLVISNVNQGVLSFENTRFVPESYYNNLTETRKPQIGDILYTTVGSYGIPVIVDSDKKFCFQRHMALMKPKSILTKFLWYLLQTNMMFQKATNIATGTAQMTVPIKGLRQLTFDMPSLSEQEEIVRILDKLLEEESKIDELTQLEDQIDLLKKSILAKAFRGELGANDPTEDSAMKLLKEVLKEKIK